MCRLQLTVQWCLLALAVAQRDHYYHPWDYSRDQMEVGRTRFGEGFFRFLSGGRDVELRCDFPTHHIVSNIIWERVTDPTGRSISFRSHYFEDNRHYYDADARSVVLQRTDGASLFVRDVAPEDAGVYRCLASRRVPHSVGQWAQAVETIFQDVHFFPAPPL